MTTIRQPAVADMFYPADPNTLQTMIDGFLADANVEGPVPKALMFKYLPPPMMPKNLSMALFI